MTKEPKGASSLTDTPPGRGGFPRFWLCGAKRIVFRAPAHQAFFSRAGIFALFAYLRQAKKTN